MEKESLFHDVAYAIIGNYWLANNIIYHGLVDQIQKKPEEPGFVHITTLGVLVHPRKSLFADRGVNSLQLRDLLGVTVALAVSTPVSPVTQNCSDNGEGRSFVT